MQKMITFSGAIKQLSKDASTSPTGGLIVNLNIDGYKFSDIHMEREIWEYVRKADGERIDKFWMVKKKKSYVLMALETAHGERYQGKLGTWLYRLNFVTWGWIGAIPSIIYGMQSGRGGDIASGIMAEIGFIAFGLYLAHRKQLKLKNLDGYTPGTPADFGEKIFGSTPSPTVPPHSDSPSASPWLNS